MPRSIPKPAIVLAAVVSGLLLATGAATGTLCWFDFSLLCHAQTPFTWNPNKNPHSYPHRYPFPERGVVVSYSTYWSSGPDYIYIDLDGRSLRITTLDAWKHTVRPAYAPSVDEMLPLSKPEMNAIAALTASTWRNRHLDVQESCEHDAYSSVLLFSRWYAMELDAMCGPGRELANFVHRLAEKKKGAPPFR